MSLKKDVTLDPQQKHKIYNTDLKRDAFLIKVHFLRVLLNVFMKFKLNFLLKDTCIIHATKMKKI